MTHLEAALVDVAGYLESRSIPYMVIGGYANSRWGRPRLTEDIDLKVQVPEAALEDFLAGLGKHFKLRAPDPLAFVRETFVVPIATPAGVGVDLVLTALPYEEAAIRRAVPVDVNEKLVRLCTAEDLILHKVLSERRRDLDDVEGVIVRQGGRLDRAYLDRWIKTLATELEREDIIAFYRQCLKKAALPDA